MPLLRPFKKIGLAGMRRWVPRHFLRNTAVIRHKPASEDTSVSLVHWQEPYSHRGRLLADSCSQLPGLRRLPGASAGSLPDHRPRELSRTAFKRLRPFKELAAQQLLKLARASLESFKPFKPQAPQGPPF